LFVSGLEVLFQWSEKKEKTNTFYRNSKEEKNRFEVLRKSLLKAKIFCGILSAFAVNLRF